MEGRRRDGGLPEVAFQILEKVSKAFFESSTSSARWTPCELEAAPKDWSGILATGIASKDVPGFDPKTGQSLTWPLR